ncbi:hypothetical protein SAMN06265368_0433 [Cohaesibacter gelatinilyticus]|uniref:Uncharacterized protein n=1 Tax=Cohaesibacter gelatinilyticus TaxID=372072 RepID=A0A285NEZ2_9HYPH|nr:hypothetical protein SAMN06265368_0433 [Cohaesibacter gelatinilyticus]
MDDYSACHDTALCIIEPGHESFSNLVEKGFTYPSWPVGLARSEDQANLTRVAGNSRL